MAQKANQDYYAEGFSFVSKKTLKTLFKLPHTNKFLVYSVICCANNLPVVKVFAYMSKKYFYRLAKNSLNHFKIKLHLASYQMEKTCDRLQTGGQRRRL